MRKTKSITKSKILSRLMAEGGLSYVQAVAVHNSFMGLIEECVTNQVKMNFGRIGAIVPKVVKSKTVAMNFSRTKKGVEPSLKYFFMDPRVEYKLRLFDSYMKQKSL